MKLRLVENWRQSWRWASVQLAALVAVLAGIMTANPGLLLGLIQFLPSGTMRTVAAVGVSIVVFVIPTISRLIEQNGKTCDEQ